MPVINENNKLVGLITFRDISKQTKKPKANKDEYGRLRVCAAVGITNDVLERVTMLKKSDVDAIVIDTAHAHSKKAEEKKGKFDWLKNIFKKSDKEKK